MQDFKFKTYNIEIQTLAYTILAFLYNGDLSIDLSDLVNIKQLDILSEVNERMSKAWANHVWSTFNFSKQAQN